LSQGSGLAGTINPDRIGWDLQVIDEQNWIVCIRYGREFRWGKWLYSEKQSLQSQLMDGKLILDCQQPPVVDVGTGQTVDYEDFARAERRVTEPRRRRQRARVRIDRFLDSQPLSERRFFRLSEIIEYCARSPGRLIVDPERKLEIFELVRTAIYAGEFGGERAPPGRTPAKTTAKPTRIRWISEEPSCQRLLPRDAAAPNGSLFSVVDELLISRGDALAWFRQRGAKSPEWIGRAEVPAQRSAGKRGPGRPEVYDWAALEQPLAKRVKQHGPFASLTDLAKWCIENVKVNKGVRRPKGDALDVKNTITAIKKHGLDKIGLGEAG
jgi:hypothetical protein